MSDRLRVLIVSQYFWPENFRINDLVEALAARGHEVTVLTSIPNYPEGRVFPEFKRDPAAFRRFAGAEVIRVPQVPRGTSKLGMILNYLSFLVFGTLLGPWRLRGRKFDAIFFFGLSPITSAIPATVLRRLKRAPLLLWVLDLWPETLASLRIVTRPSILGAIGRVVGFIYRRCDLILVQSRAFFPSIEKHAGFGDRTRHFPGWAEGVFEDGADPEPAPELERFAGQFKVLFAGNIGEAQDFPAILDAAELLRDEQGLRIVVAGEGSAAAWVRAEIERRGLHERVAMLGRFPLERMPSFFQSADALLVTLGDADAWAMTIPGKVQSYLAAGRPILAMLNGEGARALEESGAALVAPAGNGAALAAHVRTLMAAPETRREEMGRAGQAYSRAVFAKDGLVDRLEGWMREARSLPWSPVRK